jgi:hypothetical protein
MHRTLLALALPCLVLAGCGADGPRPASAETGAAAVAAPDTTALDAGPDAMDARLDAALVRFRTGLPVATALADGERSRDALVRRFVRALARADTTDLRRMTMTRAEFAYLYYPGSAYTRRPTRQEADLVWFLHLQQSQKGVSRALARYGAAPLRLLDHDCAPVPVVEGATRLWHGCRVRIVAAGRDTTRLRLFGPILERDGVFKVYSYGNDL